MSTVDKYAIVAMRVNKKRLLFLAFLLPFPKKSCHGRSSQTQRFTSTNAASMWADEQGSSSMGDIPMRPRIAGFQWIMLFLKLGNPGWENASLVVRVQICSRIMICFKGGVSILVLHRCLAFISSLTAEMSSFMIFMVFCRGPTVCVMRIPQIARAWPGWTIDKSGADWLNGQRRLMDHVSISFGRGETMCFKKDLQILATQNLIMLMGRSWNYPVGLPNVSKLIRIGLGRECVHITLYLVMFCVFIFVYFSCKFLLDMSWS